MYIVFIAYILLSIIAVSNAFDLNGPRAVSSLKLAILVSLDNIGLCDSIPFNWFLLFISSVTDTKTSLRPYSNFFTLAM